MYIVKNAKGEALSFNEISRLFPGIHPNYHDVARMSVQVDVEDYSAFSDSMSAAGYSVEEYCPSHD